MGAPPAAAARPRETRDLRVGSGLRIHVAEWGDPAGLPFLLLHGGAQDSSHWTGVCRRLPGEVRCIVPDARGHGRSDWSPRGDYACASQVEDLLDLLGLLGIDRCVVGGHSMGGLNALWLAGHHPSRVRGLVLIDVGTENREEALEHLEQQRGPGAVPPRAGARPDRALGFDTRLIEHVPTFCGDAEKRRALLRAADAPLLVLRGARSRIMSRASARATAGLVGGELVEIEDAGHNVATRNPSAVANALADFLLPIARGTTG